MNNAHEFDRQYAARQLHRSRNILRRSIKYFYINNILRDVRGPTIDFGCGAGQLLSRLPAGSVGLELNPALVAALLSTGLNARQCFFDENFLFSDFLAGHYKTFVMSHVLEHFDGAENILRKILRSCQRLEIERVIVVLPCALGYRSDPTHKTFVNRHYLDQHELFACEGYTIKETSYFPINVESAGNYFIFNELKLFYIRTKNAGLEHHVE